MKKIIFLFITLLLLSGCNERNLPEEGTVQNNSNIKGFSLYFIPTTNCTNQVTEYLTIENRKVYLVCVDEIYLKRDNTKDMTLKYHLQNVNQTLDDSIKEIVSDISDIEYLRDGGTKIYKHSEYTIIICNTLDNNKDIYFGLNNLEYQEDYCK